MKPKAYVYRSSDPDWHYWLAVRPKLKSKWCLTRKAARKLVKVWNTKHKIL